MRLRCVERMFAHWGSIFEEGKEYDVIEIVERKVGFVTDYDSYWEKTRLIASSRDWIRKGYTKENLHEAIPGYLRFHKMQEA